MFLAADLEDAIRLAPQAQSMHRNSPTANSWMYRWCECEYANKVLPGRVYLRALSEPETLADISHTCVPHSYD